MLQNAKALVVVLAAAWVVFHLARPLCLQYMREETFRRRRNVWLALTVLGFLSPSFSLYALIAAPLLFWAGLRDDNPATLFVMMAFAIPDVRLYLSLPGINQLFDLNQFRLLALTVLVPAMLREPDGSRRTVPRLPGEGPTVRPEHVAVLLLVLLQAALMVPYETATTTLRRVFLGCIDSLLLVVAFGRLAREEQLTDTLCGFWLACAVMAPLAVFESVKGWLLYTNIAQVWGDPNAFAWLFRGNFLRAQVAAGHSINLGYHLALGLTLYLALRRRGTTRALDLCVFTVFTAGVYMTHSRAAWLTLALMVAAYVALRPGGLRGLLLVGAGTAAAVVVMSFTPLRENLLDQLPFIGRSSQDTVAYRQELLETSLQLIRLNPWLGDPFVTLKMEHLRQGQGIIDIVNGYLSITLFAGLVGLALLLAALLLPTARAFLAHAAGARHDPDLGAPGAALLACMAATLFYIAANNYGYTTYLLCGLLGCHAALARRVGRQPTSRPSSAPLAQGAVT